MQTTEEPTVTPMPPSASAMAYLGELEGAAELAGIEFEEARAADRRNFLLGPGRSLSTAAKDGAMNAPELHVMTRIQDGAAGRLQAAHKTLGFVAWWWATSAITVLEQRAAGREITARSLEHVTLHLPAAERAELEASGCMRPTLHAALAELRAACGAAMGAEMILEEVPRNDYYRDDDDRDAGSMRDHEASELHDLTRSADRIPQLLLAYAHAASDVARYHRQNRQRSN